MKRLPNPVCGLAAVSLAVIQLPHKLKSWNIYLGVWKKSVVSLFKPNQKLLESIWSLVQHQGARALTTSSGPGFSLKQEGISYLCSGDIPAVIADVMRIGSGLGDIFQGQGDYWQLTRGGGHGDYHTIVLAPSSVQENADLAYISFDLAEKYRHPVLVASDAAIGQMVEPVELPAMKEHDINQYDWVIRPRRKGENSGLSGIVIGISEQKNM